MLNSPMFFSEALGDVLRELRHQHGMTLRDVAGRAFVSLGYLSEVERGQKECSSTTLAAIASGLGVRVSMLLRLAADHLDDAEVGAVEAELAEALS